MIFKSLKFAVAAGAAVLLLGGFVFGREMVSYVQTSANSVRTAVKDSVPVEFELQRARTMLEQIIPEMHASIRTIAQEEVELKALERDIEKAEQAIADERTRLARLREELAVDQANYRIGGRSYSRDQVRNELSNRLNRLKESEVVLASKQRMLQAREQSLTSAIETLESTKSRKALLEEKVAALESQHRLVQATATNNGIEIDDSKLAQTEKLIGDIRKRLDVAERVLAREAQFVQPMELDPIEEQDLLADVDAYLESHGSQDDAEDAESTAYRAD